MDLYAPKFVWPKKFRKEELQIRGTLFVACGKVGGLERWLMDPDEIRIANRMVKEGTLYKGRADNRQKNRAYFKL